MVTENSADSSNTLSSVGAEEPSLEIAALDLGSNSFHIVIGRVHQDEIRVLDKLSEKVMLAGGLTQDNRLDQAAMERGLDCLQRFAQRLVNFDLEQVRVVATNALRVARNRSEFIRRAEAILGRPVELISGREEARLIYLGVAHTVSDDMGRRLVIDIGGGSTEFIIGERFESMALESLHMGCVSYGRRFFPGGKITAEGFSRAITAARSEIELLEAKYKELGWDNAVGASGTVRSIEQVLIAEGMSQEGIHLQGLLTLVEQLIAAGSDEAIPFEYLKPKRRAVFAPGLAILTAIFQQMGVTHMVYSDGALREGVLYDQMGRFRHEDVRDRTIRAMGLRYHADDLQAQRVADTALKMFDSLCASWGIDDHVYREVLSRAAQIHEIGLAISHSQFHKHGAYIITHSDLSGFSRQQQQAMASLVRCHRRKISPQVFDELTEPWRDPCLKMTLLLRISVLLHHNRSEDPLPPFKIDASANHLALSFSADWLQQHPLTRSNFEDETIYLEAVGFSLHVS